MYRALAAVVDAIAAAAANSRRAEDRKLAKDYLAALAPMLAGAVMGKNIDREISALARLIDQSWLVDEEPILEGLSMWRTLVKRHQDPDAIEPQSYPAQHFEEMIRLTESLREMPAQLEEHQYAYTSFGSWVVIVRFKGIPFRVVFDGRQHQVAIERSESMKMPYSWGPPLWRMADVAVSAVRSADIARAIRTAAG